MNRNSIFNSRKFKYGSAATAFTVAFIAIVVIFNIIFSALARKYMWYVDLTKEQVYTLSEEAKEIMSDVSQDVNIHFASEPDELMNGQNASYTRYIYTTASDINTTNVIVESGGEVRNFAATAFFTFNDVNDPSTVWAYSGEKRLISGIMQVTQTDKPIVSFTTEHGEALNTQDALTLMQLFDENGFTVTPINLSQETVDDDCRILVIYDPEYDFIGAEAEDPSRNEIEKVDKFLDRYGCLMVFGDPAHADKLTNLNEFLEEWGIAFTPLTMIRDTEHAMSVDSYSIVAEYQKDTLGASIYSDLNALATPPKSIIRKAAPIEILWETGGGLNGSRDVSPVLKSYDTSELVKDGMVYDKGSYNLVTISREQRIVSNEYYYSYVIAAGSPSFAAKDYLDSNAYANDDILSAAMKAVGRERVLAVLELKPFDKSDITVTTAEANRWTIGMTTVIPAIFAVCGLVVMTRRKHS